MTKGSGILNVIRERRSVRRFDERPVELEKIMTCIEAARLAPSAENAQPWRFIIMEDVQEKQAFGKRVFSGMYRATRWAMDAPVLMVILADQNFIVHRVAKSVQTVPFQYIDIGIAGEHFALQAQALGLGTCWIGWFHVKEAQKYFQLPKSVRVLELMAVGYPRTGAPAKPRKRKTIEEIAFLNRWGHSIKE